MTQQFPSGIFRLDDLAREIYGLLGIPVDVVTMQTVLNRIEKATAAAQPYLISTANLNFLVASQSNREFRESLLLSDLCTADGMPIVWLGRLLGIPIKERIAGADIFDRLKSVKVAVPLKVFFFGGEQGVAAAACEKLNAEDTPMTCVGSFYPGFVTVDDLSTDRVIDAINTSKANFLAVALGAQKGQMWLQQNHQRLQIPVQVHLGATINFQAGTVKRAPFSMQKWGLEWLWRIKEEPKLWKRYWNDGATMVLLLLTKVLPLILVMRWNRFTSRKDRTDLRIEQIDNHDSVIFGLNGTATADNVGVALPYFANAATASKSVVINFTNTSHMDARFLGLLLMLDKVLTKQGHRLVFKDIPPRIARILRLSGFEFLVRSK